MKAYILQAVMMVILAVAAYLGSQVKNAYTKLVTTEVKQAVCRTAVRFVEQVYTDLHGEEKLRKAMSKASALLAEKGIEISENELVAMLEAAVNEFNEQFSKRSGTNLIFNYNKPADETPGGEDAEEEE